jgi:hypothetical protein
MLVAKERITIIHFNLLVFLSKDEERFPFSRLVVFHFEEAKFELKELRRRILFADHLHVELGIFLVVEAEVGVHVDLLPWRTGLSVVAALVASAVLLAILLEFTSGRPVACRVFRLAAVSPAVAVVLLIRLLRLLTLQQHVV